MKPQKPPHCYFFYTFLFFHEILSKVENIWLSNDRIFIRQSAGITERWKFSTIYYFSTNHKTALYFQLVYYFEIGRWSKNFRRTGIPADCCTKLRSYETYMFWALDFHLSKTDFLWKCFVTSLIYKKNVEWDFIMDLQTLFLH